MNRMESESWESDWEGAFTGKVRAVVHFTGLMPGVAGIGWVVYCSWKVLLKLINSCLSVP